MPWLEATQILDGSGPNQRGKYKSAYMTAPSPHRVDAIYSALTDDSFANPQALLQIDSHGCQINAVDPAATAVAQRSSIMKLQYQTSWVGREGDAQDLTWIRDFYRRVYAKSGGVPAPNRGADGCYVNYPDVDLMDWERPYYKVNYLRFQQVKARCDPNDIFHHPQSIRLPGS
jgi:FAD/FMN-containing dehydrogenase